MESGSYWLDKVQTSIWRYVRTLAIEEAYTTKYSIHPREDTMLCGFRLTNLWLSIKKDTASCGSKYLAYSEEEVEYQGSSGLLLQPETSMVDFRGNWNTHFHEMSFSLRWGLSFEYGYASFEAWLWVVKGLPLESCSMLGKKDKLEPSYVGPFEILGWIRPIGVLDEFYVLSSEVNVVGCFFSIGVVVLLIGTLVGDTVDVVEESGSMSKSVVSIALVKFVGIGSVVLSLFGYAKDLLRKLSKGVFKWSKIERQWLVETILPSPDYTPVSPDYSPASDTEFDPSKDLDILDTPPSPTYGTPFTKTTLSTQRLPIASGALRRRVMVLAPGQPIPYGRPDSSSSSSSKTSSDSSEDALYDFASSRSSSDHSLPTPSSGNDEENGSMDRLMQQVIIRAFGVLRLKHCMEGKCKVTLFYGMAIREGSMIGPELVQEDD
ncbi:hypothetical protein Tco_0360744 [Tanacetum coccineum]